MSVTVANLVMEEIEEQTLSSFSPTPRFWRRYADYTCTVLPSDSISRFHDHLNTINLHILEEEEEDHSLPFLDVLLLHEADGSIQTSVYRKPKQTDKYLHFSSHHPLDHKTCNASTSRSILGRCRPFNNSL